MVRQWKCFGFLMEVLCVGIWCAACDDSQSTVLGGLQFLEIGVRYDQVPNGAGIFNDW